MNFLNKDGVFDPCACHGCIPCPGFESDNMTALELCEKVLALKHTALTTGGYIDSHAAKEKYLMFVETAAPLLAKIVRCYYDAVLVLTKEGAKDAIEINLKEYAYAILEEADCIARGEK